MRVIAFAFSIFASLGSTAFAAEPVIKSAIVDHCRKDETVYFSCITKNQKMISVCGSKDPSGKGGNLAYRFGPIGKVELEFPKSADGLAKKFFFTHYDRARTNYAQLRFEVDKTSYVVFDRKSDEDGSMEKSAGVEVTAAGAKSETTVACGGKYTSRLSKLQEAVPCDPDDALNMGECEK